MKAKNGQIAVYIVVTAFLVAEDALKVELAGCSS